jgi:arylformamidase
MGQDDVGLPSAVRGRIQKIVPISPVADLLPLMQTEMNVTLKLTKASAKAESPAYRPRPNDTDVHIWVGAEERPVFLEQAKLLATNWQAGLTIEVSKHHFDIIAGLEDPDSSLMAALLED